MRRYILIALLCSSFIVTSAVASSDELMEKINRLEQQIKELKELKEQQKFFTEKEDHCMKAVSREKFCKCLATGLPRDITFEQYVHTLVTPKSTLGYETMTPDQKQTIDDTLELRDKCIEKGFF